MNRIISISDSQPDFIYWQLCSIKKFIKNEYEYIVFNNASDEATRQEINKECIRLGIKVIELFEEYSKPVAHRCSDAMNTVWNQYAKQWKGNLFWIDGDMFPISEIDLDDIGEKYDIGYQPIYRENNSIECMWTGALFFNLDAIDKNIDFSIAHVNGVIQTDTAGATYYWLQKNKNVRKLFLRTDIIYDFDESYLKVQLNGCTGYIEYRDKSPLQKYCEKRFFPHEKESDNYLEDYYQEFEEHKRIVLENDFPKPYDFDLMKQEGHDRSILFHFKSASWADRYKDKDHLTNKKIATKKFLGIPDE